MDYISHRRLCPLNIFLVRQLCADKTKDRLRGKQGQSPTPGQGADLGVGRHPTLKETTVSIPPVTLRFSTNARATEQREWGKAEKHFESVHLRNTTPHDSKLHFRQQVDTHRTCILL